MINLFVGLTHNFNLLYIFTYILQNTMNLGVCFNAYYIDHAVRFDNMKTTNDSNKELRF